MPCSPTKQAAAHRTTCASGSRPCSSSGSTRSPPTPWRSSRSAAPSRSILRTARASARSSSRSWRSPCAMPDRARLEPNEACIVDPLTTLYTRVMLEAVLAKEVERAGRFGDLLSLILFDVDRLSAINEEHGYGVGDRILERLGILIRKYFRQYDWVARHSDDSIAVLLT